MPRLHARSMLYEFGVCNTHFRAAATVLAGLTTPLRDFLLDKNAAC